MKQKKLAKGLFTWHLILSWHLTAETVSPTSRANFLAVFWVHRQGEEDRQPQVEILPGTGAVRSKVQPGFLPGARIRMAACCAGSVIPANDFYT